MKEKQKNYEKGITLIALVITIIVLLILAGVTLRIVMNGGIINKSQTAVNKYTEESAREKLSVAVLSYKMGTLTGEAGEDDGKKTFKQYVEEIGGELKETTDTTYKVRLDGYDFIIKRDNYEITSNGQTTGETEQPETPEVKKYTVTINKGTGIESVTASQQVEEGKSLGIEATVASGYIFSKWNITNGTGTIENEDRAITKITPTGDIIIEATAVFSNINGNENAKVGSGKYSYNNPVIPVGFRTSNEGASWSLSSDGTNVTGWNEGLVIQDGNGNQFVWVPVDGTNVTYDYHYNVGSQGSTNSEQGLPTGVSSEDTQITTYKGFYIARYEAGIPETLTSAISTANETARNVSGIPVSKKNQVPWNYISWSQAKTNAESMYKLANTNSHVQSTLITDRMWETTMQWLENANINVSSDSRSWGNYSNAAVTEITEYSTNGGESWTTVSSTKKGSTSWLLKTGHTDYTSRKNIYDLAGNLWELTNSGSSFTEYVIRGGDYDYSGTSNPAAYRGNYSNAGIKLRRFPCWAFCTVTLNSDII